MDKKDKSLVLDDICSRLMYHVRVRVLLNDGTTEEGFLDINKNYADVLRDFQAGKIEVIPYLRKFDDMTENEKKKFDNFCVIYEEAWKGNTVRGFYNQAKIMTDGLKYLNRIHVDYRGLLEKGLAIEATDGMYSKKRV